MDGLVEMCCDGLGGGWWRWMGATENGVSDGLRLGDAGRNLGKEWVGGWNKTKSHTRRSFLILMLMQDANSTSFW